jgi:uncharacterized Fe-S center protein
MYDNYNYPAGADTPDAPWNQSEPDDKEFLVDVEYILQKKNVKVTTKDYRPEVVINDEEIVEPLDTSDTNWENAYEESGHLTIQELLNELKEYVKADMQTCSPNTCKGAYLKRVLEDCDGWELYDKEYKQSE